MMPYGTLAILLCLLPPGLGFLPAGPVSSKHGRPRHLKRQYYPSPATGLREIRGPQNVTIRYKVQTGEDRICETVPGVNSYSGYVDLAPDVHVFFWFFESRRDPAKDDITLWLNGGPGADSLIGALSELGPCRITPDLETVNNVYSWSNVSNLLFISQPVGVGFSYQGVANGTFNNVTNGFMNASQAMPTGTYPTLEPLGIGTIGTTDLAAVATWHVLQAFLSSLPCFQGNKATQPQNFNLWTESYGGHYGPSFFEYFSQQNEKIRNGSESGYEMAFKSLGIISGIIDSTIQEEYYPKFAVNNTYGIKAYNDTVCNYALFANSMPNGCQEQIQNCIAAAKSFKGGYIKGRITNLAVSNPDVASICTEAQWMCEDNVEGPYYAIGKRGAYDIRHPTDDPTTPSYFVDWLNQGRIQQALGVSLNYTESNADINLAAFSTTGDIIYPNFKADLADILDSGVRVALVHGDADYSCNWMGGEAVSKEVKYKHHKDFNAAGYAPFVSSGVEYGTTREYGNFSFTNIYESGHMVPYYQPMAALALFERVLSGFDVPQGMTMVTGNLTSKGSPNATHTESFVPLPPTNSAALAAWSSRVVASYDALDTMAPVTATAAG